MGTTVPALTSVAGFSGGETLERRNRKLTCSSPSRYPTTSLQSLPKDSNSIYERISALAPSSAEDDSNSGLAIDNEYGSAGPWMEKFVVFDAAVAVESSKRLVAERMLPSGKRKIVNLADGGNVRKRVRKLRLKRARAFQDSKTFDGFVIFPIRASSSLA